MSDERFSGDEQAHYARHFLVKGFGPEGQARLKAGKVLVVGAGGLGCPALMYLAAAGVGHIGIVEDDTVDVSNLHRQLLFGVGDIGAPKGAVARQKLLDNNPHIDIRHFAERLSQSNVLAYVQGYDVIVDATDNFTTKYLLNDACYLGGKPLVYASISQFEGQVGVFNLTDAEGRRSTNCAISSLNHPRPAWRKIAARPVCWVCCRGLSARSRRWRRSRSWPEWASRRPTA